MRRLAFAVLVVACGCNGSSDQDPDGADDHAVDRLVLEGQEIVDLLGDDGLSEPIHSTAGFRRLGVMWDASAEGALEVRTSADGVTWSEWAAPSVVSHEEIAHAGHVDAIGRFDRDIGSLDSDPRVLHYQLRVPAGAPTPTFIDVEPLADIPPHVDAELASELPGEPEEADKAVDIIESVVRTTPIGNVRIYSRADWGARPRRCASGTQTPNRATIHHTVTPTNDSMSVAARLRQIQSFHMYSRGWCDIGYNYLVSRDGRIWRGRGATTVGAHVENSNTGNVGVSFIGTYTSTAPTATQMCQTAKLLRRLRMDFPGIALTRSDVKGHRQYGSTSCPGNALYARIDDILRKATGGCEKD